MTVMTVARTTSEDRRRPIMAGFRSVARGRIVPYPARHGRRGCRLQPHRRTLLGFRLSMQSREFWPMNLAQPLPSGSTIGARVDALLILCRERIGLQERSDTAGR